MLHVRVGLAQLNTTVGDLEGNLERIAETYGRAEAAGCDLVAFPELAVTGYPPEDLVLKPGFVADTEFQVRGAVRPRDDGGMAILARDTPSSGWRTILEVDQADALTTAPLAFAKDGRRLLALSSSGADTSRLVWLDCADGSQTVVAADPGTELQSTQP